MLENAPVRRECLCATELCLALLCSILLHAWVRIGIYIYVYIYIYISARLARRQFAVVLTSSAGVGKNERDYRAGGAVQVTPALELPLENDTGRVAEL